MTVLPQRQSIFNKVLEPFQELGTPGVSEPLDDPFKYGWRLIPHTLPNGEKEFEHVPLTLEDILHPQVGDFRVQSHFHNTSCTYLYDVFRTQLRDDPNTLVLHDVRVAWRRRDIKPHGPDVAVIFGVRDTQKNWSTFDEVEEDTKPSLIVEITSPSTRNTDLNNKLTQYAQTGVPYYFIIDTPKPRTSAGRRLLGYELVGYTYRPLKPNAQGWLWMPPVDLWLGLEGNAVRCYDLDGQVIEDMSAIVEKAESESRARRDAEAKAAIAEAQAVAEAQARQELEARFAELEAELRRLRGEA